MAFGAVARWMSSEDILNHTNHMVTSYVTIASLYMTTPTSRLGLATMRTLALWQCSVLAVEDWALTAPPAVPPQLLRARYEAV